MILFILKLLHRIWHKNSLGECFWISRLEIKWEHRKCPCWRCEFYGGFWYDNYTFECQKEGTLQWNEIEDYECNHFQPRKDEEC